MRLLDSLAAATIEPKKDEYDWFDFFLSSGVAVHDCERYARNFSRDSMDESILPEITAVNLRTLGLKEGDIFLLPAKVPHNPKRILPEADTRAKLWVADVEPMDHRIGAAPRRADEQDEHQIRRANRPARS